MSMAKKVTYTLDDHTIRRIETTAQRLQKPKSQVVREAIADYSERAGRLSEQERLRMLDAVNRLMSQPLPRGRKAEEKVDREIEEIHAARRQGGRRHRR